MVLAGVGEDVVFDPAALPPVVYVIAAVAVAVLALLLVVSPG